MAWRIGDISRKGAKTLSSEEIILNLCELCAFAGVILILTRFEDDLTSDCFWFRNLFTVHDLGSAELSEDDGFHSKSLAGELLWRQFFIMMSRRGRSVRIDTLPNLVIGATS